MDVFEELNEFYKSYKGEKGYIGFSEEGRPIPYFKVEKSPRPVVIAQYAIHAREYITTYLAMLHVKDFFKNGRTGRVYFIPMVNPDGINICLNGKPKYKANARGVDLNVNFDAGWGTGEKNVKVKGDENYIGENPFSESETQALRDFTVLKCADGTVSFHSKGEVIYYGFNEEGERLVRERKIAEKLSKCTGYSAETSFGSAGGYKDWCIDKLNIPAFTVEVGSDELSHPIKKESLEEIYKKTKDIILTLTESL